MIEKIHHGNNIEVLKQYPDNYFDSIVTDPPYGLGKDPSAVDVLSSWLKSGYHEVKGKGFMGKEWDAFVPQPIFWKECLRVLKPGGYLLSFCGTRTYDWIVMGLRLSGFEIRDQIAWLYGEGFPKSMDVGIAVDKHNGVESKVISRVKGSGTTGINDAGNAQFVAKNQYDDGTYDLKEALNEWNGWGTALKPALEPIVMARKPLDGTVVNNVLKHGVGAINIDGSRVGTDIMVQDAANVKSKGIYDDKIVKAKTSVGRFPANVIHDGSDEVVSLFPKDAGGSTPSITIGKPKNNIKFLNSDEIHRTGYNDGGSAARFFYVAKASQFEREYGLENFNPVRHSDRVKDDGVGGDNPRNRTNNSRKNFHPTVKPIDLMRYLIKLVTPKGGIVLDPYAGSGTTLIAAKLDKYQYVGIELEQDYIPIIKARIDAHMVHYDIFDYMEE